MFGLKEQRRAGSSPSLRNRCGTPAGSEVPKPGLQAERNPRTRSGAPAETRRDARVRSRRGCVTEADPILEQSRLGSRARSKVLGRDGEWAEIKIRIRPGTVEGIQEDTEPPLDWNKAGEMGGVRMGKPGATPARSEETYGDLVTTLSYFSDVLRTYIP